MRIFATRDYALSRLPFGARLFYSLFLVMVFLGLLTCLGFAFAKSGFASAALADYYRGDDSGAGAKPFVELLETAHFHLFSMPIFFLVLGHIFFLSSLGERTKLVVILAAFVALLAEIVLPWLIVYHSRAWVWLEHPTRLVLLGTFAIFIAVPLREMWWTGSDEADE
ncbi:MAG TPA: hypothetical protein VMR29_04455 [Candidatus Binatia bacterium]|nr:hypothetical protein [Candidatus Binatia bacterium]